MAEYGIILFHTTSAAFAAEKALKKIGMNCRLVPTPREVSSDCGVALRVEWSLVSGAASALEAARVEIAGTHKFAG